MGKKGLVKRKEFEKLQRHDTMGSEQSDRTERMCAFMHNLRHNIRKSLPLRLLLYRLEKDTPNRIQHRELSNFRRLAFNDDKTERKKTGDVRVS
jgi:hypothetical protein